MVNKQLENMEKITWMTAGTKMEARALPGNNKYVVKGWKVY